MDNKKIGSFIAQRRKSLGLSQQQLAEKLDISNKAISKWETGEGFPDISTVPELCRVLCISTDDFFAGETKGNSNHYNYGLCKDKNTIVIRNSFAKTLIDKLEFIHISRNIGLFILYAFYISIVYYSISTELYHLYPGEIICIWLFLAIPIFNMIIGAVCTLKKDISVSYCICVINGFAIMPFVNSVSSGIILPLAFGLGYMVITFLGIVLVFFIKNKYEIKISKKSEIHKIHYSMESTTNN